MKGRSFSILNRRVIVTAFICLLCSMSIGNADAQIRRRYHGIDLDFPKQRCSMELIGAEVADVLRAFADQYKINLVIGNDITGKIDLTLNNVLVEEAFLSILRTAKLAYIKEGEVLRILSLEKLNEEIRLSESSIDMQMKILRPQNAVAANLRDTMKNLLSKRDGAFMEVAERTNSILVKDIPEKLEEIQKAFEMLDVEKAAEASPFITEIVELKFLDTSEIVKIIKPMLSSAGKVESSEKTSSLIITDKPENLAQIKNLLKKMDKPTRQVHIEAKIVETTKDYSKTIGVQWGGYYTDGPPSGKSFPRVTVSGAASGPSIGSSQGFAVNIPITPYPSYGGIGLSLGHLTNKVLLDMQLTAMEDQGEGRILSSPKIVTLDNTKALIETGARIPIRTIDTGTQTNIAQTSGSQVFLEQTYTTEYIEAFTQLEVTPHITSDKRIKMKISAKKDRPDFSNEIDGNPAIFHKGAQTELIVKDGDTTVIGGLSTSETSESQKRVPWFATLPIIGNLFKNKLNTKSYDEVLIFITPHIIEN